MSFCVIHDRTGIQWANVSLVHFELISDLSLHISALEKNTNK